MFHGAAVLGLQPWRSADAASSATPCGVFRWVPYSRDERMGLNHQMSSLSCAMNEAAALHRTLLLPPTMCIDGGHNKKRGGARCVPLESLFDLQLHQRESQEHRLHHLQCLTAIRLPTQIRLRRRS